MKALLKILVVGTVTTVVAAVIMLSMVAERTVTVKSETIHESINTSTGFSAS
jgi:hypothetical protein